MKIGNFDIDIENNIKGLQSNYDKTREKYFKIIYPLSDSNPELLYPYWDLFIEMLYKPEVSNKYYAIHLIANLIKVDLMKFLIIGSMTFLILRVLLSHLILPKNQV